ncbi:uncharacterized protein TA05065 [Theileria annulata]|uniref:Uncharacterized protein n=1 Tax=Theileria annulata TaxID=5874 RepID=Q4UBQ1_THEAN|nr:uncharacterized protein TA05065 [Theileria annulata]CAI75750.1 hypothetical protein TA05065 [Theileria annulata]|eukprot:XP_955226.1 hypothetical protein TA05065 [Theileria annulata]
MLKSKIFIFSNNFSKFYPSPFLSVRHYSLERAGNSFNHLIKKLDKSVTEASKNIENHEKVMEIVREFLNGKFTLEQNSLFLSKITSYDKLSQDFWSDYIVKLNDLFREADSRRLKISLTKASLNELNILSTISTCLIKGKQVSKQFASFFLKSAMRNLYNIIPDKINIFNSLMDYLVYSGYKEPIPDMIYDVLIEASPKIQQYDLIHIMHSIGTLGQKNEQMIEVFSRILNNKISKGLLTRFEKTKLVKAYSLMNYEHITFFNHITKELLFIFSQMELGNCSNNPPPEEDNVMGIGTPNCSPTGVIVDVMKYIRFKSHVQNDEFSEWNKEQNEMEDLSDVAEVKFNNQKDQVYTCGQIISILDSMIYLKFHHLEPEFKKLVNNALKHLYKDEIIENFDPEQLRSSISLLAVCRKSVNDQILELITRRFIQSYVDGKASNSQLSLFLKDLVKLTRIVIKRRNIRNKMISITNFVPPKWINNPLLTEQDSMDPNSSRSMIEHLCYKICENVNTYF